MVELVTFQNQITLKLYLSLCVNHESLLWVKNLKDDLNLFYNVEELNHTFK
jgi:hypothetical protein